MKMNLYHGEPGFNYRELYSDTWTFCDDMGRKPYNDDENGKPKNKYAGIFYFLWHEKTGFDIYDHTKAYHEGGLKKVWKMISEGPMGEPHYWAEPYFGYYRSDDRWVIRRHAMMLTEAGIDFIFFDCSNNLIYKHICDAIFDEYRKMRSEGLATPQIIFFLGDREDFGENQMKKLWEIYKDNYEDELWFRVNDKPLILGNLENVPEDIRSKFTVRKSWAFNCWTQDGVGKWPWLAEYPQYPGKNPNTKEVEELVVSCGYHPTSNKGRSFNSGIQPTDGQKDFDFQLKTSGEGIAFSEQWSRVWEIDPKYLLLTGFNEWWAGRWQDAPGLLFADTYITSEDHQKTEANYYVDNFNEEFSRDIEPMKGGFGDNYYYQMVKNLRRYKGTRPALSAFGQKTIEENGDFSQWDGVGPEFRDAVGDITSRKANSHVGGLEYTNDSGRNDLKTAKVSGDEKNWYFYIETAKEIVRDDGKNWMNLFINADRNYANGWHGFNFVVNRFRDDETVWVEKNVGDKWQWQKICKAKYEISGNRMHIAIPKDVLNTDENGFDFKWADNSVSDGDIMQFMDLGDAAPGGRFNYRFILKGDQPEFSDDTEAVLGKNGLGLKANSYYAALGENIRVIDEKSTSITPRAIDGILYAPKKLLREAGLAVTKIKTKTIGGRPYASLDEVAQASGKDIVYGEKATVMIAEGIAEDSQAIRSALRELANTL